jgi:mRNA-degrading endonuclease toxin of MazEF toxin-antitoxin module
LAERARRCGRSAGDELAAMLDRLKVIASTSSSPPATRRWRTVARQGEVYRRADTEAPLLVVVASGAIFNSAGTGITFVCPVLTTLVHHQDYAAWLPFDLPSLESEELVRGVVIPERLYFMPTSGLASRPVARLPDRLVQRMRATIKSIFD